MNILVTVLNWGLGHASRSIPIIRQCIAQGHCVYIASDGAALALLQKEFPELPTLALPPYGVTYQYAQMWRNILRAAPQLFRAINAEHKQVAQWVAAYHIEVIISDNRYGCYHQYCKNILVTHQLQLPLTGVQGWVANRWQHRQFEHFDTLWIPDVAHTPNLSGKLGHPTTTRRLTGVAMQYVGILSRMQYANVPKRYDRLLLLSGPEPSRTRLENLLFAQLSNTTLRCLVVRGVVTAKAAAYDLTPQVRVIDFMTTEQLNAAILAAAVVVSRTGYSTLLDLVKTQSQAILMPTPQQPEQLYLAQHIARQGWFGIVTEETFVLEQTLPPAQTMPLWAMTSDELLASAVANL